VLHPGHAAYVSPTCTSTLALSGVTRLIRPMRSGLPMGFSRPKKVPGLSGLIIRSTQ
jgi:hypothetical protein